MSPRFSKKVPDLNLTLYLDLSKTKFAIHPSSVFDISNKTGCEISLIVKNELTSHLPWEINSELDIYKCAVGNDSTENIFKFQEFIKIIDKYKKEKEDSYQVNHTRLIIASFEYLTRNILLTKEFGKKEFRYCELLQDSIDDLDKGIRPNTVLNNFAIVSSKL